MRIFINPAGPLWLASETKEPGKNKRHDLRPVEKINSTVLLVFLSGFRVVPASEDIMYKVSKKDMNRYRVRQDPGPENALGAVKLVFSNKYNVYLHDTPTHGLFKQEQRAFSHGCIRMDRPAEMAAWVLGGEEKGWSLERVNEAIASQKRQVAMLEQPIPVLILYRTTFVNPEDQVLYFYEDIYGRDKLLVKALINTSR